MPLRLRRLLPGDDPAPLYDTAASRIIERAALADAAPHALLEAAGLAIARLALALAPHAQRIWVAAGPGHNGGDGLVAARWLQQWGRTVQVSWHGQPGRLSDDAAHAYRCAGQAGLVPQPGDAVPEADGPQRPELVIDALLGLGPQRPPEGAMAHAIETLAACRRRGALLLAVDLPTGLCGDTGRRLGSVAVQADATLALLTAKPGLFTAEGRDAAGEVWWDDLGVAPASVPTARLAGRIDAQRALAPRLQAAHASHKGRFGDLWVVGGATGMVGAALLAARAGLRAGAGRVYLSALSDEPVGTLAEAPELMPRRWAEARAQGLADHATVVCGCGGGGAVRHVLPELLQRAPRLVLDADALNAVASDPSLAALLEARGRRGAATVLTPHPLEAARLLSTDAGTVQAGRLAAAQRLGERFQAVVVLKGSGSVVAAPGEVPALVPTGNARLATAGTGDVLAGWIGGSWCGHVGARQSTAHQVAIGSAWLHGRAAECNEPAGRLPLPASRLIDAMAVCADALPPA